ncbi:MAG: hypothetical protein R3C68_03455 [Myxococcota bacterium]
MRCNAASGILTIAVWGFLATVGCARDVGDIDRTAPNKVAKAIFDDGGEWHYRATVIETQFTNTRNFVVEGVQGNLERIRWEIRRDVLIAYRSYEVLIGAEEGTGDVDFNGAPVAVFPIESHFDVIREYNKATGEQSNVIVEDDSDRPWFDRQYMRVDWSTNLLKTSMNLSRLMTAISSTPFYVQEHEVDSPYRPEVTATNINIVNNFSLTPYPLFCVFRGICEPSEALVKLSFVKLDDSLGYDAQGNAKSDYEPFILP